MYSWPPSSISLPLMGIGNREVEGKDAGPYVSLPLMGIGNFGPWWLLLLYTPLITPHGDRERSTRSSRAPTSGPHYPSWGSGTRRRAGRLGAGRDLITPHGDREPGSRCRRNREKDPHYPSWGSGTSASQPFTHSSDATHYPSWGSGTLAVWDGAPRSGPLITPHGDREHGQPGTVARPEDALITPHGDRERRADVRRPSGS